MTAPHRVVRIISTDCILDDCSLVYTGGRKPPVFGEDTCTPLGRCMVAMVAQLVRRTALGRGTMCSGEESGT